MSPHPDRPVSVVTGATSGIGRALAGELRRRPGTVVLVGRDPERVAQAVAELDRAAGPARIDGRCADLSRMAEVNRLADDLLGRYPDLQVLVNNAGAYYARREVTVEGHERTWALNVLAPFLLTHRLIARLEARGGRVVNVASWAHRGRRLVLDDLEGARSFRGFRQYGRSKLALIMLTYEFARRLGGRPVTVNALHPGFVRSRFGQNNGGAIAFGLRAAARTVGISATRGARTPLFLSISPAVEGVTGEYFVRGRSVRSSVASYDAITRAQLWEACRRATGIPPDALAVPASVAQ